MNKWRAVAIVWLIALGLEAQVEVSISLPQEQFLPGEDIIVTVRIGNQSGQPLKLGQGNDWLTFSLDSREGFPVTRTGLPPVEGEFTIESARVASKKVNLTPYFSLLKPGRYQVAAAVKIPQWQQQAISRPVEFTIAKGHPIWEQEIGVPPPPEATNSAPPEVRKYALLQANFRRNLQLYVRVSDPSESRIFALFPLGRLTSVSRPEAQVDRFSNLHVLLQTGAKTFIHNIISPQGRLVVRHTYEYDDYTASRPRFARDPEGRLIVKGGLRRISSQDLPPPEPSASETSPATNAVIGPRP